MILDTQRNEINACYGRIRAIFNFMGLFPVANSTVFYDVRRVVSVINIAFLTFGCFLSLIHAGNLMALLRSIAATISATCVFIKIFYYAKSRDIFYKMEKMLEIMTEKNFKSEIDRELLLKPMVSSVGYCNALLGWGCLFALPRIVEPYIMMVKGYVHQDDPSTFKLILGIRYVYHLEGGSFIWFIHFMFETYVMVTYVFTGFGTDIYFCFISSKIIGNFRVLNNKIKNLDFEHNVSEQIKEFVTTHYTLINCCKILQEINGVIIFVVSSTTAFILCSTIYQIRMAQEISRVSYGWIIVYTVFKFVQILLYSLSGELILKESENYIQAVYTCDWFKHSIKGTSDFFVKIVQIQRPIVLSAAGFGSVNLQLFASIVNATISYSLMLRTLTEAGDSV